MIRNGVTDRPNELRHSYPDETAETEQPSFSNSLFVITLLVSSSSATRICMPLNREFEECE